VLQYKLWYISEKVRVDFTDLMHNSGNLTRQKENLTKEASGEEVYDLTL
jgi:hypothetical protein